MYLRIVSAVSEARPAAGDTVSRKHGLRLLVYLGWLLMLASIWFVRGTPKPRRRARRRIATVRGDGGGGGTGRGQCGGGDRDRAGSTGEPEMWKLALWLIVFVLAVPAMGFLPMLLRGG
jgi:hypothetical protein